MRIAQISTLCTPVRRDDCGSVEGLVWLLSRELVRLGHEVTVFATGDSEPPCELVGTLPAPYGRAGSPGDWQLCEWINLCRAVEQSGRFDLMHSHGYFLGLPMQGLSRSPLLHTLHVQPAEDQASTWKLAGSPWVSAVSHFQWSGFPEIRPTAVIHHGVDPELFTYHPTHGDYLCYLGRFMPEKGPLEAIDAARKLGMRLLLAGPANPYFHKHIEPRVDGRSVEYVGYVTGPERIRLVGNARALLFPVQYPEPFGLVVCEAMMCGTPVVAMRLGAVPELIDEGITGYIADSAGEFADQITRSFLLDRGLIRKVAETRFSSDRMARQYERLYDRMTLQ